MAGFVAGKTKRKGVEEAYDELSGVPSPATKSRRLDAELPPVMEAELPSVPLTFRQQFLREKTGSTRMDDAVPAVPFCEERAIVLYRPEDEQVFLAPLDLSSCSLQVNSDVIRSLKTVWTHPANPGLPGEKELPSLSLASIAGDFDQKQHLLPSMSFNFLFSDHLSDQREIIYWLKRVITTVWKMIYDQILPIQRLNPYKFLCAWNRARLAVSHEGMGP